KGPWLESTSPSFSIPFTSPKERFGDSDSLMCGEVPPVKDQDQKMSTGDLELEDSSRNSPFVTEGVMTACEEPRKLEKSTDETEETLEGQIVTDTTQGVLVNDRSEQEEAKNTSEDTVEKLSETKERVLQNPKASSPDRALSSVHLKKKEKSTAVSSQYLGRLKVLEDKRIQRNGAELDKADSLRAAVFQNWLEKKRTFLLELKRTEKKKAENLKADTEKKEAVKKEEAIASFEAWKKKKRIEAKKLSEKKKLEELKKQEAAKQSEEKTEAAQKVKYVHRYHGQLILTQRSFKSFFFFFIRNKKKEEYMKQKKTEKILERRKQKIQQAKKEEKNKKAMEEYERWLEKKERREQLEKKQKKLQPVHGDEVPSPWSPPGKVTYSRNY
ncbi:MAP9 protein, partial [Chloroceryle aenea]|nr:MAP9 protein [Chloroceryle aenea]